VRRHPPVPFTGHGMASKVAKVIENVAPAVLTGRPAVKIGASCPRLSVHPVGCPVL